MKLPALSQAIKLFKPSQKALKTQFERTGFSECSYKELLSLRTAKQEFADCYLISSLDALTRSNFGRNIIQENARKAVEKVPSFHFTEMDSALKYKYRNILQNYDIFDVTFKNVNNKPETFKIDAETFNKKFNVYIRNKKQNAPLLAAIEIAMDKLVSRHFFKKPLISRLTKPFSFSNFEYNFPSNFLKMFTGKDPVVLGERNFNKNLLPYKQEALELFRQLGKDRNRRYSFVAGTGFESIEGSKSWHCFVVRKVDLKHKKIHLIDKRTNRTRKLSFEEALKKLKYIVGYFDETVKQSTTMS